MSIVPLCFFLRFRWDDGSSLLHADVDVDVDVGGGGGGGVFWFFVSGRGKGQRCALLTRDGWLEIAMAVVFLLVVARESVFYWLDPASLAQSVCI